VTAAGRHFQGACDRGADAARALSRPLCVVVGIRLGGISLHIAGRRTARIPGAARFTLASSAALRAWLAEAAARLSAAPHPSP
jgi:hypothetical protein